MSEAARTPPPPMTAADGASAQQVAQGPGDTPPYRYTAVLAGEIEARWQDYWAERGTFIAPNPTGPLADPDHPRAGAEKFYLLDMFPYPSGTGLHVGHPLGYIGTDCFGRYQRMAGRNVLHAMGFDAFGLPAEQHAVQTGQHPRITTEANVERYRAQLRRLGMAYDERRTLATTDVAYYRWTQWIFLQIFNSWYDSERRKARPIAELVADLASGARTPQAGASGRNCRTPSGGGSSTATGLPTSARPQSTGARGWAPCWPTRRSLPRVAASAATSRCSSAACGSG
jgi:leucyl-tRNA synthetase